MRTTSLKGTAATSSLAAVFQESNHPLQPFVRLAPDFGRVAPRPIVKALAGPNAEIATSDHVLKLACFTAEIARATAESSVRFARTTSIMGNTSAGMKSASQEIARGTSALRRDRSTEDRTYSSRAPAG